MPNLRSSRLLPLVCLAGAVLFWGTSFVATKIALRDFSPMTVIWLRMTLASLVFAPLWHFIPRPSYRKGDWRILLLTGLLMPCLYYLFEGYAVRFTTSSQAGVISSIVPLLVAAGAWLFLRERLTVRGGIAIGVSLVGVAMLSLGGAAQADAPNPLLGNSIEVLAMISAAGWMLAMKYLSERYNPWFVTGAQAAIGVVFFLPGALASDPSTWLTAPAEAWVAVAYLGVFVSIGAFGLYNTAVSLMPASRAALSINLIPAVALLAGWLVLGESLTGVQLAACAIIVGAVIFGESSPEVEAADEAVAPHA